MSTAINVISNARRDSLVDLAIRTGDKNAYNEAAVKYFMDDLHKEFLFVSITVANKFENPAACYHTYDILMGENLPNKPDTIDLRTKNLALFYLYKSFERGSVEAKDKLVDLFGSQIHVRNSDYYLQQLSSCENR